MQAVTTIGLDIAKSVFQIHGVDAAGNVIVRRQLKRRYVLPFFQKLPPCLIGIEACASSHHWSRELKALGHTVRGDRASQRRRPLLARRDGSLRCTGSVASGGIADIRRSRLPWLEALAKSSLSGKARGSTGVSGGEAGSTSGLTQDNGYLLTALRRQGLSADELVL